MSAQETLFRHCGTASTAAFALITVSNPSPARDRTDTMAQAGCGGCRGGVSYLDEAVVEEEPEGGGDGDECLPELGLHHPPHDVLHVGACVGVVVPPKLRRSRH
ncbi:unnamed protein product [Spirodela intermedia]|uniref:Uncharacterized protein n=2 Tax=Spirodela intermedia TaxID=51605 RepID=A0A7I8K7A9_SPIIN|nr:unnamed protein product [Spirodela intermedia]CAA6657506.1 unnamed protein product [Spirodela intermedia]CAA7393576.1 unnamed protein product [Spirodela intermedia]